LDTGLYFVSWFIVLLLCLSAVFSLFRGIYLSIRYDSLSSNRNQVSSIIARVIQGMAGIMVGITLIVILESNSWPPWAPLLIGGAFLMLEGVAISLREAEIE